MIYDYQPGRKQAYPETFLKGYQGYLQTDGYQVCKNLKEVTQIGCLAHGRRKFVEGLKVVKEKTESATMCSDILKTINKIFSEDRKTENLNLEEKQEMRLKSLTPLFDKFKNELETASTTILPKSVLGKAITYNLNQFESFKRVLLDPRLELTNNRAERAIKPFVIVSKKLAIQ